MSSHVACESLDDSTCAKVLHSPPIASPKLVCLGDVQGTLILAILELRFPSQPTIAPFARKMDINLIFAFAGSNMINVFELRLLGSHVVFLMACVHLRLAPS